MPVHLRLGLAAAALALCIATPALAGQPIYSVTGSIATEQGAVRAIAAEDFEKIGITEIKTRVLTLGDGEHSVKGVLARDLLDYVGAKGENMKITALDGYQIDVPVADIESYDVVIATEIDGKVLSVRDKGPAWLIYPVSGHKELDDTVYESRSVWQIKSIEFN
jgi:hypothetical protein